MRRLERITNPRIWFVALFVWLTLPVIFAPSAQAHGACIVSATKPAFSSWTHQKIHGRGDMLCTKGHHRLHLAIKLQRRKAAPGTLWRTLSRAVVNPTQTKHARAIASSGGCGGDEVALWYYRIVVYEAWAVRRDGVIRHRKVPPPVVSAVFTTASYCLPA